MQNLKCTGSLSFQQKKKDEEENQNGKSKKILVIGNLVNYLDNKLLIQTIFIKWIWNSN